MRLLWNEIIGNRLLWLLVFVPIAVAAEHAHASETVLFVLSVLAIGVDEPRVCDAGGRNRIGGAG